MLIKNKKRREPILPYYAYVPIITVFVFNMLVFYGTKLILKDAQTHDLRFSWDYAIPFVPFFIVFYILAYVQWALGYLFTGRESREVCYRVVMSDLLAKFICMIFFLVLPTETTRPEVTGSGLFASLTRLIYAADTPVNLFPSIHCLESWICFRGALLCKKMPRWYAPAQLIISLFVFASTVFVKQHFLVDIVAAVAVVELCWFLTKKLRLWKFLERVELPFVRRSLQKGDALSDSVER